MNCEPEYLLRKSIEEGNYQGALGACAVLKLEKTKFDIKVL